MGRHAQRWRHMSTYATTTELTARYENALAAAFIVDSEDTGTPDTTDRVGGVQIVYQPLTPTP